MNSIISFANVLTPHVDTLYVQSVLISSVGVHREGKTQRAYHVALLIKKYTSSCLCNSC